MSGQQGFFDLDERYVALSKARDPLERLGTLVDFEIFRAALVRALRRSVRGKGGRPPYDPVLMLKVLVLQALYNLSDDQAEFQIRDRLSFMRFLGLGLHDRVPDAKTIWLFRELLVRARAVKKLFAAHPVPLTPADLLSHACIGMRFPSGAPYRWEFERDGRQTAVTVEGPLLFDDFALIVEAARAGLGIALVFEAQMKMDLAAGRLVRALEAWCPPFAGLHLYYPVRRQLPAPLRAIVEAVWHFSGWEEGGG